MRHDNWVNAISLHHGLALFRELGGQLGELSHLPAIPESYEARASLNDWLALLRRGTSIDPLFAWRAGARAATHEHSPVSVLVGTAATGLEALLTLVRYFPCVTNAYNWEVERRPDGAALVRVCGAAQEHELAVAYDVADICAEANRMTGTVGLVQIAWAGAAQRSAGDYRAILGVEPVFDAPMSGVLIPELLLTAPMPAARPGVRRFVEPELEALLAACQRTQTLRSG